MATRPWRVARSLDHLLAQINAAHPNRSKVADGSIGDAAHAATKSEHNPDVDGVVRARDFTHDPEHGFDAHAMADALIASRDPRILYVISRGRIASSQVDPWRWRRYTGTNRHDHHVHVSVVATPSRYDNVADWTITKPTPAPQEGTTVDPTEINRIWTTPQTRNGTTPDAKTNESPLTILTRIARNVETIADRQADILRRLDALEGGQS